MTILRPSLVLLREVPTITVLPLSVLPRLAWSSLACVVSAIRSS